MAKAKGFQIYTDAGGGWRWRLIHPNGNVIADGSEGYSSRAKALQGLRSVRGYATSAPVSDEAGQLIEATQKRAVPALKATKKPATKKPAKKKPARKP